MVHSAEDGSIPVEGGAEVIALNPDFERTRMHEAAVMAQAKRQGRCPHEALRQSRALRAWSQTDLRAPYRKARQVLYGPKAKAQGEGG